MRALRRFSKPDRYFNVMFSWPFITVPWLLAAESPGALTAREWDWPESPLGWAILLGGGTLVLIWVIGVYRRDAVELSQGWKLLLPALRLAVLVGLLMIALNPQDRTQRTAFRPSRVAVLVDTSLSMRHPKNSPGSATDATVASRSMAASSLLSSPLLDRLRRDHEVSIFTFDSAIAGPHLVLPQQAHDAASSTEISKTKVDWGPLLEPRGIETRLGEALSELIRQSAGRTLSGVVVISDGGNNAGVDPVTAHDRALAAKARLIAVGVGGADQPLNLQVADIQSPTDVQLGDKFDLTAFVQGEGLAGRDITVSLWGAAEEGKDFAQIAEQELVAPADGVPAEIRFQLQPAFAGAWKYAVRVQPKTKVVEFNSQDNEHSVSIQVFDRPTRVLLLAGGPMRDYQFVRNLLYRHKAIDVDVYLQTASVGTSQESNNLLPQFPGSREQLFAYDVIIAFDPDWRLISADSIALLEDWVAHEGGGLILVAGDVNTVQVAAAGEQSTPVQEQLLPLRTLYPVVLNSFVAELRFEQDSSQPWPLDFTPEGKRTEFLQLTDDPVTSAGRWKEFPGFFRCYPTSGAKAGATVLARFSDPRSQSEYGFPILIAEQFYGQGRVLYLGSGELWRLRSVSDEDYDRIWVKSVRAVGQGRSKRGTKRGVLLPETRKLLIGQTARVRARLLDSQFAPLIADSAPLDVFDPMGKPLVPSPRLRADGSRPGEFVGDFRVGLPGVYKLELAVPESDDRLSDDLTVALPRLEDQDVRQNVTLLKDLVRDTGGEYLPISDAERRLPELLPNRGEPFSIDERLRTLWDRDWVMYLLVGLLGAEWLIRKLLKLA